MPDGYLSLDQGFPKWARLGSNQRPLACEAMLQSRFQGLKYLQINRLW